MIQKRWKVSAGVAFRIGLTVLMLLWLSSQATAADRPIVEECMRCHDVKTYQYELSHSPHAVDKNKKKINCDQCHDFHYNPLTSYYARDAYYDKKIFQPEDFDRRAMQKNVREAVPDKKCQKCHEDLYKNVKGEKISRIGQLCHDAYLGKDGSTNRNCAGCHINIAHLPEFDRVLMVNAEFAKKLAENPMKAEKKGGQK